MPPAGAAFICRGQAVGWWQHCESRRLLARLAGRVGDSSSGARAAQRDRREERGRGARRDSSRCRGRQGSGAPPNKPADPQTRLSLLFLLLCPWALQWLRRADEGQTEGERRNSYGLRSRWIPAPVPPTLPSLKKRIGMPRCQGTCPLSLEGLLLGQVPGCPSLLSMIIRPYIATEDPTRSFPGRGWIERAKQLTLEGHWSESEKPPCLANTSYL